MDFKTMSIMNEKLERAVCNRNFEEVKALLSRGAYVDHRVGRNRYPLLHITYSVEMTKVLLLGGAAVNARNMYGETPLHDAITKGKGLELVRELLKHGVDVNGSDHKGNTALNQAVKKGSPNLEVTKELLEHGADINIRNREQRSSENYNSSLDNAVNDLAYGKLLIKVTLIRNFNKDYKKIINLAPYEKYRHYSEFSTYLDDCVCEVLQMKTDEIKDGFPLYEIVTNNFNIHELCNNRLSIRVAKIDYSVRYPIYNDIILDKIKPFLERVDLLNKLSKIQVYTTLDMVNQDVKEKKIILDHDSTYNITEYLSNDNLLNLIVAFDNSNERAFQSLSSLNNLAEPGTETFTSNDVKRVKLE